jgi:aminomethyltransferase
VTNDVSSLEVGQAMYTMMCAEHGGIIDDLIVYRFEDWFRLVVNAANIRKDLEWVERLRGRFAGANGVVIEDESAAVALMALQGPQSQSILSRITEIDLDSVPYYRFDRGEVAGARCVVSRTGYTGEDGFEVYCSAGDAPGLWDALLEAGAPEDLLPAGLGARDTLRLEAGYALYGSDIDETISPLEARLGWTVKLEKGDFVGRDALLEQKQSGVSRRLAGFELADRGFPRPGYEVLHEGEPVGKVRSGTFGPTVQKGIGTVYVPTEIATAGTAVEVVIRERSLAAEVVRMPFYREGSVKR